MLWQREPPLDLSYCLNIHRGEAWRDVVDAVENHTLKVRDAVAPGKAFGLGLRMGARAVAEAGEPGCLESFERLLRDENLYVFSVNGFPYGRFHGTMVKEEVYRPDWTTSERVNYTKDLARMLAEVLTVTGQGSISTVPVSYKPWMTGGDEIEEAVQNLADTAAFLAELEEGTGKEIHLGLEPEPDCFLETTGETIAFFEERLFRGGAGVLQRDHGWSSARAEEVLRRHLGVCFDTCHIALQFEDLAESWKRYLRSGIRLSKVQISNAVEVRATPEGWKCLEPFDEPVYLHQVKAMQPDGGILGWPDLPAALREGPVESLERVRAHFHVPLFFDSAGPLGSTGHCLDESFLELVRQGACSHFEIETYAYNVLPPDLRSATVEESIAREFEWLLGKG